MNGSKKYSAEEERPDFFCLWNRNAGAGEIQDSSGKVVWTYRPPRNSWNLSIGFLWRPEFILVDASGNGLLRVSQTKRFPLRKFVMTTGGSVVASIEERSRWATDYAAQFLDGPRWSFRKPLYSPNFFASNESGGKVRVEIYRETIWYIHRGDTQDNLQLIAAIAFIHSEHCRT